MKATEVTEVTEVTAGLAESNGSLLPGLWRDSIHVTCGLTACTPGSDPGPTLGNEYGKTFVAGVCLEAIAVARVWRHLHHLRSTVRVSARNTRTRSAGHHRTSRTVRSSVEIGREVSG